MTRRRWVYAPDGTAHEVTADYVPPPRADHAGILWSDRSYDGMRSPLDGQDISTRTKHREYMRANNLGTMDDYKGQWNQQAKVREQIQQGTHDRRERRAAIERAIYGG